MYSAFARIYDAWQRIYGTEYAILVAPRVNQRLRHHVGRPRRLLDLGCGTGTHALLQCHGGTEVIGLDISPAMVKQARNRAKHEGKPVQFVIGDMRSLDIEQSVDAVTCLYASLNHLLGPGDLSQVFRKVSQHLRPGGVFVFDLNSRVAFETLWRTPITERGRDFTLHRRFEVSGTVTTMHLDIEHAGLEPAKEILVARWFEADSVRSDLEAAGLNVESVTHFNPFPGVPGDKLKELWTVTCPSL
ncbi:MAG: hypothetical protein CL790_02375 [Chloroflexi bacterium]|nr:hypothetical protein [Chloroflexota bacterium]HCU72339.1 hypothetical protein [Chloroflexota bacterium]